MKQQSLLTYGLILCLTAGCGTPKTDKLSVATCDYLRDVAPINPDGSINAVIEIPAGTLQKWETNKRSGFIEWPLDQEGNRRLVQYLPYPANYGMIPGTWLPPEEGGDNDPLDVFVLGEAVERGSVMPVRILGSIQVLDKGEQDDKLIAAPFKGPFGQVQTLSQLRSEFPGIDSLLVHWIRNYKRNDVMQVQAIVDESQARATLNRAIAAFPRFEP